MMVDQRRDSPVRVILGMFGPLLLVFGKIEKLRLVSQAELFEDDRYFPEQTRNNAVKLPGRRY